MRQSAINPIVLRTGGVFRWNKPDGESLYVYVNSCVGGTCDVSLLTLMLDENSHETAAVEQLESLYSRPIKLEEFADE